MKVSARFDYSNVDHSKDNTVHLLLTVEAPAVDWVAQRPRICILPVIDVSGSMEGNKLLYAKQACKKLIEQLKVGDYSGLIVFNTEVRIVVKPAPVTTELKARLNKAVDELRAVGGTNFSESIVSSLKSLGDLDLHPSILQRAIFFTDGQPTAGVVDPAIIKELVTQKIGSRSMSFFGYGVGGGCDQDLLTDLSQLGKGNYAYVQNPDDALAAFGRELGGLLSTYASDLRLVIEPRNGHTIEKVVTSLASNALPGAADVTELAVEIGDILAEEARHVVLECSVKKQDKALPRDFTIFNVKATCRRVTQDGEKASEEASTTAKMRFVGASEAQTEPDADVGEIVSLHQLAVIQRDAEADAGRGDFAVAQKKLADFAKGLQAHGLAGVANVASDMAGWLESASAYSSSHGYRKSMGQGVLRSASLSSHDSAAKHALGMMNSTSRGTTGNSAQVAYTSAFTNNASVVVEQVPTPSVVVPPPPAALEDAEKRSSTAE